jgi:hypothetical protein
MSKGWLTISFGRYLKKMSYLTSPFARTETSEQWLRKTSRN